MTQAKDSTVGQTLKRFALGFLGLGLAVFVGVALHSRSFDEVKSEAVPCAFFFGTLGGIVAAYGRSFFGCVLRFASEIISGG